MEFTSVNELPVWMMTIFLLCLIPISLGISVANSVFAARNVYQLVDDVDLIKIRRIYGESIHPMLASKYNVRENAFDVAFAIRIE